MNYPCTVAGVRMGVGVKKPFFVLFLFSIMLFSLSAHNSSNDYQITPSQSLFLATQQHSFDFDSLRLYQSTHYREDLLQRTIRLRNIGMWTTIGGATFLVLGGILSILGVLERDAEWWDNKRDGVSNNNAYAYALTSVILYSTGLVGAGVGIPLWAVGGIRRLEILATSP